MKKSYSAPLWRLCLCCIFWNSYTIVLAQVERKIGNHWYFGNQYGIDFSSGSPQVDNNSAMYTYEAAMTISDKDGNLLFYTNGGGRVDSTVLGYIWNRNHEVMEGGALGAFLGGAYSAAQGAIGILKPGTTDQYYLFTIDEFETLHTEGNPLPDGKGLSYFEIDMSANGGLGKVVIANEKLLRPAFEHLSITKHGNCEDYWLLARTGHGFIADDPMVSDSFYLFKISEQGVEDPVITPIPEGVYCANTETNLIRFAPDGEHFICGAYLFDFDKNAGVIGEVVDLQSTIGVKYPFSLAFSPDGKQLLSFSLFNQGQPDLPIIEFTNVQYNIQDTNVFYAANIIFEPGESPVSNLIGTPQLAPDGKIYVSLHHGIFNEPTRIYVVDFPNKQGEAVQFHGPVLALSPARNDPFFRFGNFTDHIFYFNEEETIDLDLPDQFILDCEMVEPFIISSPESYECMLWSTGDTSTTIEIIAEGTYWLEVAEGCDVGRDSFEVIYENKLFNLDLGNDTSLCEGEELFLLADALAEAVYTWQDSSGGSYLHAGEEGLYWVEMQLDACYDRDSIYLDIRDFPAVDIGNDTIVCIENELILDAGGPNNWTYEWQDASTAATFIVTDIGFYGVTVTNDCGISEDKIFINLIDCEDCPIDFPNAFSPNSDGISDLFGVVTDCSFTFFNLKIYNRWGSVVYEGNSFSEHWDGKLNGKAVAPDVYIYLLVFETINPLGALKRGVERGDLTLLR